MELGAWSPALLIFEKLNQLKIFSTLDPYLTPPYTQRAMTSNVLPLFWNLASSSKDTRLQASADLVANLESFQRDFVAGRGDVGSDGEDDEDVDMANGGDEEDEVEADDDAESGVEVDGSDDEMDGDVDEDAAVLDATLAKDNAEDVAYTVKRLVRGLASSRESSRLGFAVALTEVSCRPGYALLELTRSSCPGYKASRLRKSSPSSSGTRRPTRA